VMSPASSETVDQFRVRGKNCDPGHKIFSLTVVFCDLRHSSGVNAWKTGMPATTLAVAITARYLLMNPTVLTLPFSFMIALLVAKTGLIALNLPVDKIWLSSAVVLCTLLLYRRKLVELGAIATLAALAEMHAQAIGGSLISPDILLSVLIAIILLPASLDLMGLSAPTLSPRYDPH